MKSSVAVTLIICGTVCVLVPWFYSAYHEYHVGEIVKLFRDGMREFTLPGNQLPTAAMRWGSMSMGFVMILMGVIGSLKRPPCERRNEPQDE